MLPQEAQVGSGLLALPAVTRLPFSEPVPLVVNGGEWLYLRFPPPRKVSYQPARKVERRPCTELVTVLDTEEMKMETLPVPKEITSAVKKPEEGEGCHQGDHKGADARAVDTCQVCERLYCLLLSPTGWLGGWSMSRTLRFLHQV